MSSWWSEWSTYRPSDFLLFSPRTYYRLFELYNAELWPAQIAVVVIGAALLSLVWRGDRRAGRSVTLVLAIAWAWIGWSFHWQRYAAINWAASYIAVAFGVQALLLAASALSGRVRFTPGGAGPTRRRLGLLLAAVALVLMPLLAPALGRGWMAAELVGLAPDPTAVFTLGLLLAADRGARLLAVIPFMWCLLTGLTLWTMQQADAFVAPLLATVALAAWVATAWWPPNARAR